MGRGKRGSRGSQGSRGSRGSQGSQATRSSRDSSRSRGRKSWQGNAKRPEPSGFGMGKWVTAQKAGGKAQWGVVCREK